ncbi:MAG TPA: putative Ig domain-containing protein [Steroidobacteraceae bacterium]|nr:putative Ig domain-containing protein [Steroidobacteraceae bacterium]
MIAGCGGGGGGSGETQQATAPPVAAPAPPANPGSNPGSNTAPTITGTPDVSILVGQQYTFQPQATDAENDPVTFTIANKPDWATFDTATGRLTGTPTAANIGVHESIEITVTDGRATSALPQFAVIVSATSSATRSISLGWTAPTENDDGTPLVDLAGYRVHYGNASNDYSGTIAIDNPNLSEYLVEDLPAGTYYFAITATNSEGTESVHSTEVNATL